MTEVSTSLRSAYLAGPMRGIEEYNFPAFQAAADWLRQQGWKIESPHERDLAEGFDPVNDEAHPLDYYMQFDLAMVSRADAVICLQGWEESQGARLETAVAVALGHPVFEITGRGGEKWYKGRKQQLTSVSPEYVNATFADKSMGLFDDRAEPAFVDEHEFDPNRVVANTPMWEVEEPETVFVPEADVSATMRTFEGGATRNVETDPDYHGFFSPLAMHAYGEYMHAHRLQADGTLRASDNWQQGGSDFIKTFVPSMRRHVHDIELIEDGYPELARFDPRDEDSLKAHLAAVIFNAQAKLHFLVKTQRYGLTDEQLEEIREAIDEAGLIAAPYYNPAPSTNA